MPTQLTRSETDKVMAGVAGGIAEYYGWDPWLVRLAFVVASFAGGIGIFLYLALWIALPRGSPSTPAMRLAEDRFARGEVDAEQLEAIRADLRREVGPGFEARSPALRLLEERYAMGEIDREEFLKRRDVLLGPPAPPEERPPESA